MVDDPWEQQNRYHQEEYQDVKTDLLERLFQFQIETEEPALPPRGIPSGTKAHAAWSKQWWKQGGSNNAIPLDHLGGPGYPQSPQHNEDIDET